jgi:hypothetical protein
MKPAKCQLLLLPQAAIGRVNDIQSSCMMMREQRFTHKRPPILYIC